MNNKLISTIVGEFALERYPARKQENLSAWNSADTLLIELLHEKNLPANSVLAVNDEQGALAVALKPTAVWTDSALSSIAIQNNLLLNQLPPVVIVASTARPAGNCSAVALKIPKLLSYFEYQLAILATTVKPGTPIVAAGMDKHLSSRTASILEHYIGPTTRHRGRHKARCFTAIKDARNAIAPPKNARYYCDALEADLISEANVFSREQMDIGS
ncbi:MAG: hypothetical protein V7709_13190, partial [Halioglobus sp.]